MMAKNVKDLWDEIVSEMRNERRFVGPSIDEEKITQILSSALERNRKIYGLISDVLSQTPPDGKTYLDVLTDRLDSVNPTGEANEESKI